MGLSAAADLAQVLGAAAVVGGILFGVVQLRQFRRQRQDSGAHVFIQQWNAQHMRALDIVYALPDSAPPDVVDGDPAAREAAEAIYVNLEQLGILVHQRIVPLGTANDWAGGAVRVAWRKLRPWIEAKRKAARSERPGEWFQWLHDRLAELPARDETTGAHVAHARWKP